MYQQLNEPPFSSCCVGIFALQMGKKTHMVMILLLFLFSLHPFSHAKCDEKTSQHLASSGPPLPTTTTSKSTTTPTSSPRFKNGVRRIILSVLLGVVTGLMGALLFACLIRSFVRYLNRTPILKGPVIFSPIIDPKTLHLALRNENQLLGSSPHGNYHRTVLDNGLTIAVKRLEGLENTAARKSEKRQTQQQLERLARLRHRNLMSLRAYVGEGEGVWLVYDYVGTGSLEDVMKRVRENEVRLSWEMRLGIAVGIIKGLQYLHFECDPQILHYNLKPSNVMLDAEFEPRLADCGLAKLFSNFHMPATSAYTSPECFQDCSLNRYTDKSDIFSFGMILAILLTGRDPADPLFGEAASGGSLGQWLRHLQVAGEAREGLDKSIIGEEGEEDEMLMAVRIAVVCLSDQPVDRPSSDELVHMLTQLHSF